MDDVDTAKVVSMILLFIIPVVLGIMPLFFNQERLQKQQSRRTLLSCLLCFGAGVLLATCIEHIMPEVRAAFEHAYGDDQEKASKPIPEIILAMGFFMIYIVEEIAMAIGKSHHDSKIRDEEKDIKGGSEGDDGSKWATAISNFLLTVALSLHAIFEGLAVGLEPVATGVWQLFGAVAGHKFVIAFCMGLQLRADQAKPYIHVLYVATFAAMSSIGIAIGLAVSSATGEDTIEGKSYEIATATMQGLAAGTLLYVSLVEVLMREKSKTEINGLLQLGTFIIGFLTMLTIDMLSPDDH